MSVAFGEGSSDVQGVWQLACESGVQPSAAVGAALFPCISGSGGAKLRINVGLDTSRQMKFGPPTPEFEAVGVALAQVVVFGFGFGFHQHQ